MAAITPITTTAMTKMAPMIPNATRNVRFELGGSGRLFLRSGFLLKELVQIIIVRCKSHSTLLRTNYLFAPSGLLQNFHIGKRYQRLILVTQPYHSR